MGFRGISFNEVYYPKRKLVNSIQLNMDNTKIGPPGPPWLITGGTRLLEIDSPPGPRHVSLHNVIEFVQ